MKLLSLSPAILCDKNQSRLFLFWSPISKIKFNNIKYITTFFLQMALDNTYEIVYKFSIPGTHLELCNLLKGSRNQNWEWILQ